MRTLLHPFLPNGTDGDPVVWVDVLDEGTSLLLDMGDLSAVPPRKLLRVERAIVTHAHLDHFIGFDQLLRVSLTRDKPLTLTGPAGFIDRVAHRIGGYTWNLIGAYPVTLVVEEIDGDVVRSAMFSGPNGLRREPLPERPFEGTVWAHRAFTVHADRFDHGISVLGVAIRETERLSVNKDALTRAGLVPGPWLADLKNHIRRCAPPSTPIAATAEAGEVREFALGEIGPRLVTRTAGQRLVYLTDLKFTAENRERALRLAEGVELMICEATFLDDDRALALERGHLTAAQAGTLAREAGARRLAVFHFSPRYKDRPGALQREAEAAFGGPVVVLPSGMAGDGPGQRC